MSEFQERLWSELVREHASALTCPAGADLWQPLPIIERRHPARLSWPARRPRQLAGAFAAIVALAIAVTVATTLTSSPSSAAYAVTQHPDGTVTVSLSEIAGVTGANAQLAKLGVPVRVAPVKVGCPPATSITPIPPSLWGTIAHGEGQGILTRPALIPPGTTLVLAARQVGAGVFFTYALYRGAPPTCVAPGDNHVS